jgi:ABC-type hemin transport system ATPase subunit
MDVMQSLEYMSQPVGLASSIMVIEITDLSQREYDMQTTVEAAAKQLLHSSASQLAERNYGSRSGGLSQLSAIHGYIETQIPDTNDHLRNEIVSL